MKIFYMKGKNMKKDKALLSELVAGYKGSCEDWKIRLTAKTIVEMGIPVRHWEELMQDLMIRVSLYRYTPIQGIKESTALGTRLRSRIKDFMRKETRLERNIAELGKLRLDEKYTIDLLQLCGEGPVDTLRLAVRAAVARLDERQQRICHLFMQGYKKGKVAKLMGINWRELDCEVLSIRRQFVDMGIEDILIWREEQRIAGGGSVKDV
jgi:DNA-directed RNA polymerase specialized sigma24 family protein